MTWKQGLRPARFGSATFHTTDRGLKGGKALAVHEFPKRNSPYTEEMGRQARKWHVDAYVIGDDYMAARDALIAECEKPGARSYNDHWGRSGVVQCEDYDLKETSQEGRMARITLVLVEAGSSAMPMAIIATAAQLAGAAGSLSAVSLAGFAASGIVGQSPLSLGAALARIGVPSQVAAGVVSGLSSGSALAVGAALAKSFGVTLSSGVPARIAGAVLQKPTFTALTRALSR